MLWGILSHHLVKNECDSPKKALHRGKTWNIWNALHKFWKINTPVCRQYPLWEWDDKHALRRDHYVVTRHVFNTNKTLVNRQKLQMGAQRNNNWLHRVIRHANNLEPCQNPSEAEMHKFKSWLQQSGEHWEAFTLFGSFFWFFYRFFGIFERLHTFSCFDRSRVKCSVSSRDGTFIASEIIRLWGSLKTNGKLQTFTAFVLFENQ